MLAILVVYPLLYNLWLSLHNFRTGEFVGFHNFTRIFEDPLFFASLRATVIYVVAAASTTTRKKPNLGREHRSR